MATHCTDRQPSVAARGTIRAGNTKQTLEPGSPRARPLRRFHRAVSGPQQWARLRTAINTQRWHTLNKRREGECCTVSSSSSSSNIQSSEAEGGINRGVRGVPSPTHVRFWKTGLDLTQTDGGEEGGWQRIAGRLLGGAREGVGLEEEVGLEGGGARLDYFLL